MSLVRQCLGFFGVAPGTSLKTNPRAMETMSKNTLFTNIAITEDGDAYWEGMTDEIPKCVTSWLRTERYADVTDDAAHPNSRFTVPASQCPVMDKDWESPQGVPISAIIFGGRRSTTVPLVYEARTWEHGVFMGASMTSETTAAAAGKRGILRNDPFAMRPFCGYNMGDYFAHWASMAQRTQEDKLPKIFHVNWFRRSKAQSKFLWPGFGDNIRVIDWIFKRCDEPNNTDLYNESSVGYMPKDDQLDMSGLNLDQPKWSELMSVEPTEWIADCKKNREFFSNFGDRLPAFISRELDHLQAKLEAEQEQLLKQQQQNIAQTN
jgi:phosphoenolpyruvate carboxykinase (GTP)